MNSNSTIIENIARAVHPVLFPNGTEPYGNPKYGSLSVKVAEAAIGAILTRVEAVAYGLRRGDGTVQQLFLKECDAREFPKLPSDTVIALYDHPIPEHTEHQCRKAMADAMRFAVNNERAMKKRNPLA